MESTASLPPAACSSSTMAEEKRISDSVPRLNLEKVVTYYLYLWRDLSTDTSASLLLPCASPRHIVIFCAMSALCLQVPPSVPCAVAPIEGKLGGFTVA